jgi:hypothetical protein
MRNRKSIPLFVAALAAATLAIPSFAHAQSAENAAGVVIGTNLGGGEFHYNVILTNDSSADNANTTIGTFWFSWAPHEEFMEATPTNILTPTGWTALITGNTGPTDGAGIQFVNMNGDLLHAGQSLSGFQFNSTESPAQLAAPSSFFEHEIETQSAAYIGAPFSDTTTAGDVFTLSVQNDGGTTTPTPPGGSGNGSSNGTGNGNGNSGDGGTTNPPSAVPLPAASWQALATFAGLGLIAATKKLLKRPVLD